MSQRQENIAICLMFVSWSVMRIVSAQPLDRWTTPQLIPAALHLVVAGLFWNRNPWTHNGDVVSILWSLPSFLAGGLAIHFAPPPHQWPAVAQWLFALGAIGAVTGMLFLGKSFAIFPAVRPIVQNGPFQFIRHPIYLFELVMIAACCTASGISLYWGIFLFAAGAIVVRINTEEKILKRSADYILYCRSVRFRLIPRVW